MSWLQVECPHCSATADVPSSAADHPLLCLRCRRPYRVPGAAVSVDERSPLPVLEILAPPTSPGNRGEPRPPRRGSSPAGGSRSVEAGGAAPVADDGDGAFAATRRRLQQADVKYYYNLAVIVVGMGLMLVLAYFFITREPPP